MKLLITGAGGFMGARLANHLQQTDNELVLHFRSPPSDLHSLGKGWFACDLSDREALSRNNALFEDVKAVIHTAAFALSPHSKDDLQACLNSNVIATANLLDALPESVGWVCCASTRDVYGPSRYLPIDEKHPTEPDTFYGISKLTGERIANLFCARRHIPCASLRFAQVYGPGDRSGKVIPTMVKAVIEGRPPAISGDGSDQRQWIYLDDAVNAIVCALAKRAAGAFNIAGERPHTLMELANLAIRAAGADVEPIMTPRSQPPSIEHIDITRARTEIGFQPRVGLEEGVRRTIEWERSQLESD